MSNPQSLYRNNKDDLNVQIGEQSSTQKEQSNTLKRTEIISIISSIVSLILTFVEIDGKPSISFKSFFSLALMLSSACGLFSHCRKRNKPTTAKSKAIYVGTGLLLGGLFACGILLLVANFKSWQTSKEPIPHEIESDEQQMLAQAELYYNGEQ